MIDPELKTELDQINQSLILIEKKKGPGVWRSFFNGIFSALGYVAGLALVIVILGWILQRTGLLPGFEAEVKNFTDLVESAKKLITNDQKPSAANQQPANGTPATVTLPDGRQVQVVIPK